MVLCSLITINLFLKLIIISKLIIIPKRCWCLAVSIFASVEMNKLMFKMNIFAVSVLTTTRRKTENDKVDLERNVSSIIYSINLCRVSAIGLSALRGVMGNKSQFLHSWKLWI